MKQISRTLVAPAAIALLALGGCSKKEDASSSSTTSAVTAAKVYACKQFDLAGKCGEYSLKDDSEIAAEKSSCEDAKGKWLAGPCPAEKQFASCVLPDRKLFFYTGVQSPDAPFVADEEFAKLDCDGVSGKLTVTAKPAAAPPAKQAPSAAKRR